MSYKGYQGQRAKFQPTIRVVLCDLRCVWQSQHACKLL